MEAREILKLTNAQWVGATCDDALSNPLAEFNSTAKGQKVISVNQTIEFTPWPMLSTYSTRPLRAVVSLERNCSKFLYLKHGHEKYGFCMARPIKANDMSKV